MHLNGKEIAPTWSNAYIDISGFGLVITVTLPLVVKTSASERRTTGIAANNSVSFLGKFIEQLVLLVIYFCQLLDTSFIFMII